jgi:hypothetical protein
MPASALARQHVDFVAALELALFHDVETVVQLLLNDNWNPSAAQHAAMLA